MLSDCNIFHLKSLITNFPIKRCAYIEDNGSLSSAAAVPRQTLCLVNENDEILFRSSLKGELTKKITIKSVLWFKQQRKSIQDICFDPSGAMLLVLCYDNTLHVVPVQWVLENKSLVNGEFLLTCKQITSFVVPFAGPHECPNSKTCPNNVSNQNISGSSVTPPQTTSYSSSEEKFSKNEINEFCSESNLYNNFYLESHNISTTSTAAADDSSLTNNNLLIENSSSCGEDRLMTNIPLHTVDENPCPYPTCAVWWRSIDGKHSAIIGYSDGSICIVGLQPNCPLIATTAIVDGAIHKMIVCREPIMNNVTLMINSSKQEQWKLLLEQKSIDYVYPGQQYLNNSNNNSSTKTHKSDDQASDNPAAGTIDNKNDEDWQYVVPINIDTEVSESLQGEHLDSTLDLTDINKINTTAATGSSGLLPAARARLVSLRDLGAKKIGALKMKIAESRMRSSIKDKIKKDHDNLSSFAIINTPMGIPEILTTPMGPFFIVQKIKDAYLLNALHSFSDTLSVHRMDICLIPLNIYKIPKGCVDVLVTTDLLYTIQTSDSIEDGIDEGTNFFAKNVGAGDIKRRSNAVGVIGCNTTTINVGEETDFKDTSLLALFKMADDEYILDIFRISLPELKPSVNVPIDKNLSTWLSNEEPDYMEIIDKSKEFQIEFPTINPDMCLVVTTKTVYLIELRDLAETIFVKMATDNQWLMCKEFCRVFRLDFSYCIEYVGDILLRKSKTTEALVAYNIAKIPPVKTALKLAMQGENCTLMHLCAMALKSVYLLNSNYPVSHLINYLKDCEEYKKNTFYCSTSKLKTNKDALRNALVSGVPASDFTYDTNETASELQLSNSSQFHLSNLLLLTLTEVTIRKKQFMPLWNFLVTNKKYHTNITSIVLCQSGLYYSAVLLACARGAHLDVYNGLVEVSTQEFGWYNELNDILTNLSDMMFAECIIYSQNASIYYFNVVQTKLDIIELKILKKIKNQLDPFNVVFRPIVSKMTLINAAIEKSPSDDNVEWMEFRKQFIKTYLAIIIRIYSMREKGDNFLNALTSISVNHESNLFAIELAHNTPLSAGFSHCSCIINGTAYTWGTINGISFITNNNNTNEEQSEFFHSPKQLQFISNMNLEVHAIRCGRQHTLILTNNGMYSMGSNQHGQLGLGKHLAQIQHPMLVREFDGKNIRLFESGQYHCAIVSEGYLYTWGWGVYGQLGHGNIEDVFKPKIVTFFLNKKIQQISLGHAHTLVLCEHLAEPTEYHKLYVFGSNHYGQLGVGQTYNASNDSNNLSETVDEDSVINNNFLKSLIPIELIIEKHIRLIHTKFFTNFVVTQNNELFVWGCSPQALRLQYQAAKRLRNTQNKEEEANLSSQNHNTFKTSQSPPPPPPPPPSSLNDSNDFIQIIENKCGDDKCDTSTKPPKRSKSLNELSLNATNDILENDGKTCFSGEAGDNDKDSNNATDSSAAVSSDNQTKKKQPSFEEENTEHYCPVLVDTSAVEGKIMSIASGLYHNALITDDNLLYTWGKNLEKQLGLERSQMECVQPTRLESIERAMYVECGADFTLVMSTNYQVKSFGNNNCGQCGRDSVSEKHSAAGKLVRLRISKRVVRIPDTSQCFESPTIVSLPKHRARSYPDTQVRYLKSLPKFNHRYMSRSHLQIEESKNNLLSEIDDIIGNNFNKLNLSDRKSVGLAESEEYPNDFIHYCLFLLHGLYEPSEMVNRVTQTEFKVRILMLNYRIKEAFTLCISDTKAPQQSLNLFEYFTKDSNVIPIHREDLKFLIFELFIHFIRNNFNIDMIEQFFLNDLDYYLFALAHILYFNNNNSELERMVFDKYAHLFGGEFTGAATVLENTEEIFKICSVSFKTTVCQRILNYDSNNC